MCYPLVKPYDKKDGSDNRDISKRYTYSYSYS